MCKSSRRRPFAADDGWIPHVTMDFSALCELQWSDLMLPLSACRSFRVLPSRTILQRAAVAVSVAAFMGGCVSMEEYKAVQAALEQSQTQLAKADRDLADAR